MGVLAGGANWGCYGPSLVPVLPQQPGGCSAPPQHPRRYGPGPRPTCVASFIFNPSKPFGHSVRTSQTGQTDRTARQTDRQTDR